MTLCSQLVAGYTGPGQITGRDTPKPHPICHLPASSISLKCSPNDNFTDIRNRVKRMCYARDQTDLHVRTYAPVHVQQRVFSACEVRRVWDSFEFPNISIELLEVDRETLEFTDGWIISTRTGYCANTDSIMFILFLCTCLATATPGECFQWLNGRHESSKCAKLLYLIYVGFLSSYP